MAETKHIAIRRKSREWNKEVLDLAKGYGFTISNPDQFDGEYIDLIIESNYKLAGFDLYAIDSLRNAYEIINTEDIAIIKDWLEDHAETNS